MVYAYPLTVGGDSGEGEEECETPDCPRRGNENLREKMTLTLKRNNAEMELIVSKATHARDAGLSDDS